MSEDYTQLKGVTSIGRPLLNEQLEYNLIDFFNWGFLNIGGFNNVNLTSSGVYGTNLSRLRLINEPNYSSGQVWETFRPNLVWETGVNYSTSPISISGVYINNSFYPINTTGVYAYSINYPYGRVIFNSPIATGSVVQMEYSYRRVTMLSNKSQFSKTLLFDSFRPDRNGFLNGSGTMSLLAQSRLHLPAIVVQVADNRRNIPMQIGGGHYAEQDVLFYIFTEDAFSLQNLKDIICNQVDKTIYLYDRALALESGVFPLNYKGALNSGFLIYPDLVKSPTQGGYRYKRCLFMNTNPQDEQNAIGFYSSVVRVKCSVDCPEF